MPYTFEVFVAGHLFGTASSISQRDVLLSRALARGVPSVTVTRR